MYINKYIYIYIYIYTHTHKSIYKYNTFSICCSIIQCRVLNHFKGKSDI